MTEAWIIDACRTPRGVGKAGKGALWEVHPQQLGATVLKAIAERNKIDTKDIGDVIHINDIPLPAGARPTIARNFVIANIGAPSGLAAAESEAAEA